MFAAELLGAARHLGFDSMALAMDGLPVGTLMFEVLKHVGLLRQELATLAGAAAAASLPRTYSPQWEPTIPKRRAHC